MYKYTDVENTNTKDAIKSCIRVVLSEEGKITTTEDHAKLICPRMPIRGCQLEIVIHKS